MSPRIPHHKIPHALIMSGSEVSITVLCLLCSPITQQYESELLEKYICNQSSHYEKYGQFPFNTQGKTSRATTKLTLFTVSKDE